MVLILITLLLLQSIYLIAHWSLRPENIVGHAVTRTMTNPLYWLISPVFMSRSERRARRRRLTSQQRQSSRPLPSDRAQRVYDERRER